MIEQTGNFIPAWLQDQCARFEAPIRAAVLLGEADTGPFQPVAQWPDESAAVALAHAGLSAIRKRASVLRPKTDPESGEQQAGDILACPIFRKDHLLGVVTVEIESVSSSRQQQMLTRLQSSIETLERAIRMTPSVDEGQSLMLLDLLASNIEHGVYGAAARAVVTRMASTLQLDRVSLGWIEGDKVRIDVHSGNSSVNHKMVFARSMAAAMDEAIKADEMIRCPSDDPRQSRVAHEKFHRLLNGGHVCTVPISYAGSLKGALLFEKGGTEPFTERELTIAEATATLIGPVLYEKKLQTRSLFRQLIDRLNGTTKTERQPLLSFKRTGLLALLALLSALFVVEGNFRVTADAMLEGTVQRMIVTPLDGYIADARVRAGDTVQQGQLLAQLEDKDFALERMKWQSEKQQLQREYREAMAQYDSAKVAILKAQFDSASAQLNLAEQNLERTRIIAPMDGVLVSGDLDQSLGAPVERGDELFQIAPLDDYRVMLEVDERDIGRIQVGQQGRLALVGMPNQRLTFTVERMTPVSTAREGRNFFLVEARLTSTEQMLRPGMAGVGKVDIGREKLIRIWTREITEWFQIWLWTWLP